MSIQDFEDLTFYLWGLRLDGRGLQAVKAGTGFRTADELLPILRRLYNGEYYNKLHG